MTRRAAAGWALTALVWAVIALPRALWAHELPGSSATLVVRDGGLVELRLLVPWSDVLRAEWMPKATPESFLGSTANQAEAVFARAFERVTARLGRELVVYANGTRPIGFAHWVWPTAREVQSALRNELMERLAMPTADHHAARLVATADALCGRSLESVELQTAPLLGPMLVTAYRPAESLVRAGARSISFRVVKP